MAQTTLYEDTEYCFEYAIRCRYFGVMVHRGAATRRASAPGLEKTKPQSCGGSGGVTVTAKLHTASAPLRAPVNALMALKPASFWRIRCAEASIACLGL